MTEKALVIASRGDGPWVPVEGLTELHVSGMNGSDEIRVVTKQETLLSITEDGIHPVNVGAGEVRVERISGDSRVTVRAVENSYAA